MKLKKEDITQHAKDIYRLTKKLLKGTNGFADEPSLRRVCDNYLAMKDELQKFEPKMRYRLKY